MLIQVVRSLLTAISVAPACVVVVEVAAVAVVNGMVHAALSNAVDLTVHRKVFKLHFRIKDALPLAGGHLVHRRSAVTRRGIHSEQQLAIHW
jgi:uncharacterized membrane protein YbhN (UPF0104 family)